MACRLFYFARSVVSVGGRLQGGTPLPFVSAQDAEDGGAMIARLEGAAIAYQQIGDPEHDLWEEPELLGVFGDLSEDVVLAAVA